MRLDGAVVVSGTRAIVLDAALRASRDAEWLRRLMQVPGVRGEVLELLEEMAWAAARARDMSGSGHPDMVEADMGAESSGADDEVDVDEARRLLGNCSDRHVRRLADQHELGVKVGGRWRLSRAAVLLYRESRRSA